VGLPPPTGTVSFLNGSTVLGTATLNASGVATLSTTSLAAGTYSLTAQYTGNASFLLQHFGCGSGDGERSIHDDRPIFQLERRREPLADCSVRWNGGLHIGCQSGRWNHTPGHQPSWSLVFRQAPRQPFLRRRFLRATGQPMSR
jgi:hypothetical protein